jgi:hypothetical protein
MKKVILFLFGLMLTSVAFSQSTATGYLFIFEHSQFINENKSIVRFESNGIMYALAYDSLHVIYDKDTEIKTRTKNLFLYRKNVKWERASSMIKTDYFNGHYPKGGAFCPDSVNTIDALKAINANSLIVTIRLDILVWRTDVPYHETYQLELTPISGTKNYEIYSFKKYQ